MSRELGRYDTELGMFVENQPIDLNRLNFERWLREREGRTVSAPCGTLALAEVIANPKTVANKRTIVQGD